MVNEIFRGPGVGVKSLTMVRCGLGAGCRGTLGAWRLR